MADLKPTKLPEWQLYCHCHCHERHGGSVRIGDDLELTRNASAVSDAPRSTSGIHLPLTTGRVRYSCLKEAAGEETSMQIQWCRRDEKDSGNR